MKPLLSGLSLFLIIAAANDHNSIPVFLTVAGVSLGVFWWGMRGEE